MNQLVKLTELISNQDGRLSTTASISLFGSFFGGIVLIFAAYHQHPDLTMMFGIFMSTTCGLTVTKGLMNKNTSESTATTTFRKKTRHQEEV